MNFYEIFFYYLYLVLIKLVYLRLSFYLSQMKTKIIFIVFALFFVISAGYHLVTVFFKVNTSPLWRNLLFIVINLLVSYGLLKRPAYFIYLFILLMLQQFYSHGSDMINLWNLQHKVDWMSLLVIIMLPVILVFLFLDRQGKLDTGRSEKKIMES